MLELVTTPRIVAVTPAGVATRLGDLRREFEQIEDWPQMEVDAALFLSDVCQVLGLSESDRRAVLGAQAAAYVDATESARNVYTLVRG
jgi:hypothetical protein